MAESEPTGLINSEEENDDSSTPFVIEDQKEDQIVDEDLSDVQSDKEAIKHAILGASPEKSKPEVTGSAITTVLIAYFSVFLDTMGLSIVGPILPFYAERFNANATQLGAVYSVFALASMFANYAMGTLSDKYGRRLAILYSLFGTAVTYIIQGLAWDYWSLLGFRVLCGAFGGSIPIANAVVTDIIPRSEQPKYFGFIGATVAAAFIVGPGMGSGLSEFGLRVPFFVSGALGGFGFCFAFRYFKETNPTTLANQRKKNDDQMNTVEVKVSSEISDLSLDHPNDVLTSSNIPGKVYFVGCLAFWWQFSFAAYQAMIGFFYADKFGFDPLELGFAIMVLALFFTFTSVFIFGPLSKKIGIWKVSLLGLISNTIGMVLTPIGDQVFVTLAVTTIFVGMGNGLVLPSINGGAAMFTNELNRGKVMAFVNSIQQFGKVIGPLTHGFLYQSQRGIPYFVAACVLFFCSLSVALFMFVNPELRTGSESAENQQRRVVFGVGEKEPRWDVFEADKPTKKDLKKLGYWFGNMLTERRYQWVRHLPKLQRMLSVVFPPLKTTSFDEYASQIHFLILNVRKFDKDFQNSLNVSGVCPI